MKNFKNEVKNFHNLLIKSSERAISEGYTGAQHMLTKKDFKLAVFYASGTINHSKTAGIHHVCNMGNTGVNVTKE